MQDTSTMWAQALIEKGMLDSAVAGLAALRFELVRAAQDGRLFWVVGAVLLVVLLRPFWRGSS